MRNDHTGSARQGRDLPENTSSNAPVTSNKDDQEASPLEEDKDGENRPEGQWPLPIRLRVNSWSANQRLSSDL